VNVPEDSKRAMNTVALLTDSFKKYLDANKCECIPKENSEELDQFSSELLDHVIVVGGFCRDILLNRKINDIDIIINLRELTKLQTNHLKKYHNRRDQQSRDCKCVYWKRYLTKLCPASAQMNDEQKHCPEIQRMHNINYILNANFWIGILQKDKRFDNCLSVKDMEKSGYHSCEIVNSVRFGSSDLNHQKIDVIDTFNVDRSDDHDLFENDKVKDYHRQSRQLSMSGMDIERLGDIQPDDSDDDDGYDDDQKSNNKSRAEVDTARVQRRGGRKGRLNSMAIASIPLDQMGDDFGDFSGFKKTAEDGQERAEYVALEVPIYSGKVRYKLLNYDFSMNTCILPLSNVIRLSEYNNDYDHSINGNQNNDPLTWREVIENGLGECDGIEDCTVEKIIRSPEHDHCSIEAHPKSFIFWRIVRWLIREPQFKLDHKLKAAQMKDFDNWLNADWMGDQGNCEKFMKYLKRTLEHECKSRGDVEQMLGVMDDMRFHKLFIPILNSVPSVKQTLVSTLSRVDNEYLINKRIVEWFHAEPYQYPHLPIVVFSKKPNEQKKLEMRNEELKEELQKKEAWSQKLEDQNTRLVAEKRQLTAEKKQWENDRKQKDGQLNDMRARLEEVEQDLEALRKSKAELAKSTNGTINELRGYLVKYQEAYAKMEAKAPARSSQ